MFLCLYVYVPVCQHAHTLQWYCKNLFPVIPSHHFLITSIRLDGRIRILNPYSWRRLRVQIPHHRCVFNVCPSSSWPVSSLHSLDASAHTTQSCTSIWREGVNGRGKRGRVWRRWSVGRPRRAPQLSNTNPDVFVCELLLLAFVFECNVSFISMVHPTILKPHNTTFFSLIILLCVSGV